jgi:hypothetical protein
MKVYGTARKIVVLDDLLFIEKSGAYGVGYSITFHFLSTKRTTVILYNSEEIRDNQFSYIGELLCKKD